MTTAVTTSTAVTTVNFVAPVRSPGRSPAAEPCMPVVEPPGGVEEDWFDMMDREMADLLDSPSLCEHSEVESVDSDLAACQCVNCKRILPRHDWM